MEEVGLFGSRLSPFVEKTVRALRLKGVPFTLVLPASPLDFRRWNPTTGKMPVLEAAGERTYDSTLILRRLDALVPEPPLFHADSKIAARQRLLEDWSDESLYWYGMALRWSDENAAATAAQVLGSLPFWIRPVAGLLLPRQIRSTAWAQGMLRLPLAVLLDELERRLDDLVVLLGEDPFFLSERIGAADLALFGQFRMLRSGPTPEAETLLADRPALVRHFERVDAATGRADDGA